MEKIFLMVLILFSVHMFYSDRRALKDMERTKKLYKKFNGELNYKIIQCDFTIVSENKKNKYCDEFITLDNSTQEILSRCVIQGDMESFHNICNHTIHNHIFKNSNYGRDIEEVIIHGYEVYGEQRYNSKM